MQQLSLLIFSMLMLTSGIVGAGCLSKEIIALSASGYSKDEIGRLCRQFGLRRRGCLCRLCGFGGSAVEPTAGRHAGHDYRLRWRQRGCDRRVSRLKCDFWHVLIRRHAQEKHQRHDYQNAGRKPEKSGGRTFAPVPMSIGAG